MAEAFLPYWDARAEDQEVFDVVNMLANDPSIKHMDRAEFIGTLFLLIVGGKDTMGDSKSGGLLAMAEFP